MNTEKSHYTHGSCDFYRGVLSKVSDDELIDRFNKQVGVKVGIAARMRYLMALREAFHGRGFDCSEIENEFGGFTYARKILLKGKKITAIDYVNLISGSLNYIK